jgi:hypothetical protein
MSSDSSTADELEEARNAALACATVAYAPAAYLQQIGVDAFFRGTAEAIRRIDAIDNCKHLLAGDSPAEFAGVRRGSFHQVAWELAFVIHRCWGEAIGALDEARVPTPWAHDLVKQTILQGLRRFEKRHPPTDPSELCDLIRFEYYRACRRLGSVAAPNRPKGRRASKLATAMALLKLHPTWSKKKIATQADCNAKYLSQCAEFKNAYAMVKEIGRGELPSGRKDGVVEAEFEKVRFQNLT